MDTLQLRSALALTLSEAEGERDRLRTARTVKIAVVKGEWETAPLRVEQRR